METIKVVPAKGMKVKHPSTGHVISGEIDIESTKESKRLIRVGDLIKVETKKTGKKGKS